MLKCTTNLIKMPFKPLYTAVFPGCIMDLEDNTYQVQQNYNFKWTLNSETAAPVFVTTSPCLKLITPQITRFMATPPAAHLKKPDGLFKRMIRKVGFLDVSRSKLKASGYLLYEKCSDQVNHSSFFKEVDMPDTLFSWFLVTELHCWFVMTRAMADGDEGRMVRNSLTEALWKDVEVRMKKLDTPNRGQTLQEISHQFRAAIVGYDEGIQSNDIVLAGALWRRLLCKRQDVDPAVVELLVSYVRRQIAALDKVPSENLLFKRELSWLPLKP